MINKIDNRKTIEKDQWIWVFFEKINKIGKPLDLLKKEKTELAKIRNIRTVIANNAIEIKRLQENTVNSCMPMN